MDRQGELEIIRAAYAKQILAAAHVIDRNIAAFLRMQNNKAEDRNRRRRRLEHLRRIEAPLWRRRARCVCPACLASTRAAA